jgi:hypothetical protein
LLLKLVPLGLVVALMFIYTPENLEDIAGRESGGLAPVDLLQRVKDAVVSGQDFECSEEALNQYVQSVLEAHEAEGFDIFAEFRGLWIRLNEGSFDLVFERQVLGLPSTVSAELRISRVGDRYMIEAVGGKFGRLRVSRGCMSLIKGGIENVGSVFEAEKGVLSRAGGLTISDGWLRLEPHLRADSQ